MADKFVFEIALTAEQQEQIRQASGKDLTSLTLAPDDWPPGRFRETWSPDAAPIRAGRSFLIAPLGASVESADADRVIALAPGEGAAETVFGTGTHPTTQLGLTLLEEHLTPGDRVLDLGTGSGVLAIAAARLGAREVLALDIDPAAVGAAQQNVAANGLADVVAVREGGAETAAGAPYDLVVANLLSHIVRPLAPELARLVRPAGVLILSGLMLARVPDIAAALRAQGFTLKAERPHGDWRGMVLKRGEQHKAPPG